MTRKFAKPSVRIVDDKIGPRCHAVIDPNAYAPVLHVHFENRAEAEQWYVEIFPGWYRRYMEGSRLSSR